MNAQDMIKGQTYTITTVRGKTVANQETVTGTFVSINSKGVNLNVNGKVRSFAAARIESITTPDAPADGLTTREVADMFNIEAKVLRVHLRAMGMGVGKGVRYGFNSDDVDAIRAHLTNA